MTVELDRLGEGGAVLIAGPTASGKSALAARIAERLAARGRQAAIVNADSMQVYRELRILTARPEPAEEENVPHRLYGTVSARERYSIGQWLADAEAILAELKARGAVAIVVGGTGLYFRALTVGLAEIPPVPDEVRTHWAGELSASGPERLYRILSERDPATAAKLRPSDPQRLLRALEVVDATGRPLTEWQSDNRPPLVEDAADRIVLEPQRSVLAARISDRFDAMIAAGALEEVRALMALDLPADLPAMKAIGVRELAAVLRGEVPLDAAVAAAKLQTRRYAKRQATWFRNQMADWARMPA